MTSKEARSVIDLNKFLNQRVRVKFSGGREITGVLKGHDAVSNLVLDETEEFLRDPEDPYKLLDQTRTLGLIVARGTAVVLISPVAGTEEIANPFVDATS
ncbi:putative u6 snRNA-associated Sm-like protein [Neospora caninum Liverpool]|uniref:Putative u6 snRNA-associated Sm-like protein n=1 Tax=Neospora caninum (strain Liverpool) TaxID=572307 RepID=F0VD98_NEOCL|nr:putative u6 snRNA-associated Sm-like protein [Neospora caninum Liverpool]CBZ51613.1 putative u6 snRNA-associated Sm-like protein [Neospora caninum Liverpool]CEL65565.1 TPA: u6 snRNA-associated Sm-like protein, putative [Neospora caninum Liverpool]|eukprot:XP_003881646.1 putative u6 snRNA-associated Sm-like protein [Neospora caninum Liverpool]